MILARQNRSQLMATLAQVIQEVAARNNAEDSDAAIWRACFAQQAITQSARFAKGSNDYRLALSSARSEIQTLREIAALGIAKVNRLTLEKQQADRLRSCRAYIAKKQKDIAAGGSDRQMRRWRDQINKCLKSMGGPQSREGAPNA